MPGSDKAAPFNAKFSVTNVALVGGDEFIFEDRIAHFDLAQTQDSISISFQARDGSSRWFVLKKPTAEMKCTTEGVVIDDVFNASGEAVSGRMRIVRRLSISKEGDLIIKSDSTGWGRTLIFFYPVAPDAYYAKFMRIKK